MKAGDVCMVWFPFSRFEVDSFKRRPVLVVGVGPADAAGQGLLLVAMITSNARRVSRPGATDIVLDHTRCGLPSPSVVRASRVWTAEPRDIDRTLGAVPEESLEVVRDKVVDLVRSDEAA